MSAATVRAVFKSHPDQPVLADAMSSCIDACYTCVEACTTCADACLSERHVEHLAACIRLDLDCAAVCTATGSVVARANKAGNRQPLRSATDDLHRVLPRLRAGMQQSRRHACSLQSMRCGVPRLRRSLRPHAQFAADAGLISCSIAPKIVSPLPSSISIFTRSPNFRNGVDGLPSRIVSTMRCSAMHE